MSSGLTKKRKPANYDKQKKSGFYCMYRGWQDHPVFKPESFTEREAWEWMIAETTYLYRGRMKKNLDGVVRPLSRGQFSHSLRFMAEAWGEAWNKSRVERFVKKLQKNEMIETETETGQFIITICNYCTYQIDYIDNETGIETPSRQRQDSKETNYKKGNNGKKDISYLGPVTAWQRELQFRFEPHIYNQWLVQLRLGDDGTLYAPDEFTKKWCKDHYQPDIEKVFQKFKIPFNGIEVFQS